jgi:drug/metabolite transporter (DMT)-like permease
VERWQKPKVGPVAAAFALLSSLLWGTSDYCGGTLARRYPVSVVVVLGQSIGLAVLLVFIAVGPGFEASVTAIAWGIGAGSVGAVALGCFYRGLSTGLMGGVAPISATGAVVPVIAGLARGERPSPVAYAGIVIAVLGIVLAARPADGAAEGVSLRPVLLALVAAAGFGAVFVCLARGSADNIAMTLTAQRATSLTLVGLVSISTRSYVAIPRRSRDWGLFVVAGVFDLAANGLFGLASRDGLVSVVGVLSSLYPVVTVLLARQLLSERLGRLQRAGVAAALAGVVLLAVG